MSHELTHAHPKWHKLGQDSSAVSHGIAVTLLEGSGQGPLRIGQLRGVHQQKNQETGKQA